MTSAGADPVRALVHVAVLAAIFVTGAWWAFRTVEARLVRG